jgi:hypothetical protein
LKFEADINILMTTFRPEKLYSMPDGPPRDVEFEFEKEFKSSHQIDLPGLGEMDHTKYKKVCIVFGDFSESEHKQHQAMIKNFQGNDSYFVYAVFRNQKYQDPASDPAHIMWADSMWQLSDWYYSYVHPFKKTKIIIAGLGADGGVYATHFFTQVCTDRTLDKMPFELIIQSCTLNSPRLPILTRSRINQARRVIIVVPHDEEVEKNLDNATKNKILASPIYKNGLLMFAPLINSNYIFGVIRSL